MCGETRSTDQYPRRAIATELATALKALERVQSLDAETEALTQIEREDVSIPIGRLKTAAESLPEPTSDTTPA